MYAVVVGHNTIAADGAVLAIATTTANAKLIADALNRMPDQPLRQGDTPDDLLAGTHIGRPINLVSVCPEPVVESDEYVCKGCNMRWDFHEPKPPCAADDGK